MPPYSPPKMEVQQVEAEAVQEYEFQPAPVVSENANPMYDVNTTQDLIDRYLGNAENVDME